MNIIPIKTRAFRPPVDDLVPTFRAVSRRLCEKDVVVITSKIVSITEGRCLPIGTAAEKERLVRAEADAVFGEKGVMLTRKEATIVAWAGIDESNADGHWILWPKDPMRSANTIRVTLRKEARIKALGVVITDSHFNPMRKGAVGISIGYAGFRPVNDHIGRTDIFGRRLKYTTANIADGIAAAAVLVMGETDERVPIAIVRGVPRVQFTGRSDRSELHIPPKKDIYYPLLKGFMF